MSPTLSSIAERLRARLETSEYERLALIVFVAVFLICSAVLLTLVLRTQPLGVDLMPLWTAGKADPRRVYDFAYLTAEQPWFYNGELRPFVYPPSSLLLFKPLALMPFWPAYGAFIAATAALFVWAGARLGADWRLLIVPTPLLLVALAGQVTFLVGALVMAALSLRGWPILSGVLFGLAGAIKPQMLVLLPLALMIEGNWRAFLVTGVTFAACALASLPFGASWIEWLQALPRFSRLIAEEPSLLGATLSPYAHLGPASYIVTIPAALAAVWFAFRSGDAAQRIIALLGAALLLSPYAMGYEIALLIPAVLALKKSLVWTAPFWLAVACFPYGPISLFTAMSLLFISMAPQIAMRPASRPQEA